nr:F-box associated interaction domain-containing protein [Tanacetum cinerariifolium]
MKVYGVQDSWMKLDFIPYLNDPRRVQFSSPLCISNDGKMLLRFGLKLVVYDSKNISLTFIKEIQKSDVLSQACVLVESLVSPYAHLRGNRLRSSHYVLLSFGFGDSGSTCHIINHL